MSIVSSARFSRKIATSETSRSDFGTVQGFCDTLYPWLNTARRLKKDLELVDIHDWRGAIQKACSQLQRHVRSAVLCLPFIHSSSELLACKTFGIIESPVMTLQSSYVATYAPIQSDVHESSTLLPHCILQSDSH